MINLIGYLKEILQENRGINTIKAAQELEEKKAAEKLKRYIYSNNVKRFSYIVGVSYLILATINIAVLCGTGNVIGIIKHIVLIGIDIFVCILLMTRKKQGEIFALIGSFVFLVILYTSVWLL